MAGSVPHAVLATCVGGKDMLEGEDPATLQVSRMPFCCLQSLRTISLHACPSKNLHVECPTPPANKHSPIAWRSRPLALDLQSTNILETDPLLFLQVSYREPLYGGGEFSVTQCDWGGMRHDFLACGFVCLALPVLSIN